ncbi:hypothetical protein [uncultured Bifidobacterium sp.]|uniref:hypothetical protein n=1 Tax=uncultured Bifidobacterium sp. TaxID=165187 RepID=UPI00258F48CD|nr:hypothetical protein [uncultured Bifidobacterium sp.]
MSYRIAAGRINAIAEISISAGGIEYDLDSQYLSCGNAAGLRGFDGNPAVSLGSFAYQSSVRTVDLEMTAFGDSGVVTANKLFTSLENDEGDSVVKVTTQIGSMRTAIDGGATEDDSTTFTQHVGLSKVEVAATTQKYNTYKLTLALLDGCWTTGLRNKYTFRPNAAASVGAIDYPLDHPYDLGGAGNPGEMRSVNASRKLWPLIVITGPCAKPSVTIAGNRYAVNMALTAGQSLEINTLRKTVLLKHGGVSESVLGKAVLGLGEGSGSYIFQPLPHLTAKSLGYTVTPPSDALTTVTLLETVPAINI